MRCKSIILTWSNGFRDARGKRGALVEKGKRPWQRNIVIIMLRNGTMEVGPSSRTTRQGHLSWSIV